MGGKGWGHDDMSAPNLSFRSVTKRFSSPQVTALEEVDLEMAAGSVTAVIGVSGSGKSTLLRLAGGLDDVTKGQILIGGKAPEKVRHSKEVGWMSQHPALLPWRTAAENIKLAQTFNPQPGRAMASPGELLGLVGLADFADAYPPALSGGMQQRVSLARTLAVRAPLWLMDEPFAALDELTRDSLAEEVIGLWAVDRPTVIWVTHHIGEAVKLADEIVVLTPSPGRVGSRFTIDLERPRDETSAAFQMIVRRARAILHGNPAIKPVEAAG